jgi:putative cardiolipin synthase
MLSSVDPRLLLAGLMTLWVTGCGTLPQVTEKPVTLALAAPPDGPLVDASSRLAVGRAREDSSLLLLEENREALMWRLALIDSARSSIDIHDFTFTSNERAVAALSRNHPHFEIRIFNPKKWRGNALSEGVGFLAQFKKLNRRMHNKTWTVDRCMSIVGGRNVADHYFGLDEKYNFVDFDVLVSGPVVADISDGFDEFWNSTGAYPGGRLSKRGRSEDIRKIRVRVEEGLEAGQERLQAFPLEAKDWSGELEQLRGDMIRGDVQFLQDRAEPEDDDRHVVTTLRSLTDRREAEVILITPYLIPSKQGLANLAETINQGIRVEVLVPSLAANNQALVHGHYRKHRKAILAAGAELRELRADLSPDVLERVDVAPVRAKRTCLHGKAMVGDRRRCFIGSLNLDPRAMVINTESGLLIDSEELTGALLDYVARLTAPENAWTVTRDDRGRLTWSSNGEVRSREPKAGFGPRTLSIISGVLPIRGQL